MSSTADLVAQLVALGDEIAADGERLDKKKAEYANLNRLVTERFMLEKTRSINVDADGGVRNVHIKRQYWAKKKHEGVDGKAVHDALIASGLPELATESYNSNTLSAWMRERLSEDPTFKVPEPLSDLIEFREVTQVSVTGSK